MEVIDYHRRPMVGHRLPRLETWRLLYDKEDAGSIPADDILTFYPYYVIMWILITTNGPLSKDSRIEPTMIRSRVTPALVSLIGVMIGVTPPKILLDEAL